MLRAMVGGMVLLIAGAAAESQCPDGSPPPCGQAARPAPPTSVAVLGFGALGGDSSDVLLGEGLADELTSRLAQLGRLTVTSRAAVRRLRDVESRPVVQIGQLLGAAFLVQGTLRRSGNRLRITVELLRAASGAVAWTAQYDQIGADLLLVQEVVGTSVAEAVAGRLLPAERATLASRPTQNPGAYAAYLRGRALYVYGTVATRAGTDAATAEFRRAVQLDSSFATAWAWLSILHSWTYWTYFDRSASRLDSALAVARRAEALAPALGVTHLALGLYFYWGRGDYARSLQELSAALASDPAEPQIHVAIASVARRQGNFDLSLASRSRAIDLDPTDGGEIGERAATLRVMRRYDEAERDLRRAFSVNPGQSMVHMYLAQVAVMRDGALRNPALLDSVAAHAAYAVRSMFGTSLSMVVWRLPGPHQQAALSAVAEGDPVDRIAHYLVAGIIHEARENTPGAVAAFDTVHRLARERLRDRPDDSLLEMTLARAYAGLGRCDDALSAAERAVRLLPISLDAFAGPTREEALAEIEARCGRVDNAIDRLRRLLDLPSNITRARLRTDPAFASLRDHPRFIELVKEP